VIALGVSFTNMSLSNIVDIATLIRDKSSNA
jgi:hypothetical protein